MKLFGNKILITGGASGIGLGLTERFVQEGNEVIICSRREDVLQSVSAKYPDVTAKVCDLSVEENRSELFDWISINHPDLNVLINNAGIQVRENILTDGYYEKARDEIKINIAAPVHLTTLFTRLGSLNTILNVSSGLAFVPLTETPVYSATKSFVHSLTQTSRSLLKERGVEVIEIVPPGLDTDLGGEGIHDHCPPVSDFIEAIFEQLKEGQNVLTFDSSRQMVEANPTEAEKIFNEMNG